MIRPAFMLITWHNWGRAKLCVDRKVWIKTWCPGMWVHVHSYPIHWSIRRVLREFYK